MLLIKRIVQIRLNLTIELRNVALAYNSLINEIRNTLQNGIYYETTIFGEALTFPKNIVY